MKILFLTRLFYPHIGGVEKHILRISEILLGMGYEITVITSHATNATDFEEYKGIKIYRMPHFEEGRQKKFEIWAWFKKHKDLIKNADIVHAHDVAFWFLPFKLLYPKKPFYITFHGYETKVPVSKKAIAIRKISEKMAWGNICIGDYIAKWYGTKPTYVSYGAVGQNSDVKQKVTKKTEKSELQITLVGRLESDNGIQTFLDSLEELKKKKVPFTFTALGDGSLKQAVAKYGKAYGFVRDVESYLQNANVVFASSYLSIIEALRYKKSVFAISSNALKKDCFELAPFGKWIYVTNNALDLANQLQSMKFFTEQKQNEAYLWAKEQSWENVTKLYIKLWS